MSQVDENDDLRLPQMEISNKKRKTYVVSDFGRDPVARGSSPPRAPHDYARHARDFELSSSYRAVNLSFCLSGNSLFTPSTFPPPCTSSMRFINHRGVLPFLNPKP